MNNTDDQTAGLILSPAVFVYVNFKSMVCLHSLIMSAIIKSSFSRSVKADTFADFAEDYYE